MQSVDPVRSSSIIIIVTQTLPVCMMYSLYMYYVYLFDSFPNDVLILCANDDVTTYLQPIGKESKTTATLYTHTRKETWRVAASIFIWRFIATIIIIIIVVTSFVAIYKLSSIMTQCSMRDNHLYRKSFV